MVASVTRVLCYISMGYFGISYLCSRLCNCEIKSPSLFWKFFPVLHLPMTVLLGAIES